MVEERITLKVFLDDLNETKTINTVRSTLISDIISELVVTENGDSSKKEYELCTISLPNKQVVSLDSQSRLSEHHEIHNKAQLLLRKKNTVKPISWLVCELCGRIIPINTVENHARFCKAKGNQNSQKQKDQDSMMRSFYRGVDRIFHLIMATCVAWILGYFGMSFFWTLCLLFFIYRWDRQVKKKGWRRKLAQWLESSKQVKDPERLGLEKIDWFNLLVGKMWPTISPLLGDAAAKFLTTTLNYDSVRPTSVSKFEVTKVSFGDLAPQFKQMRAIRLPEPLRFKCNVDVSYRPLADVLITAEMGPVRVPIKLQDLKLQGRMHIVLQFMHEYPYIDSIEIGFLYRPKVDLGIQVAKIVDVTDIFVLHTWMNNLLSQSIADYMVLPDKLTFSIKSLFTKDKVEKESEAVVKKNLGELNIKDFFTYSESLKARFWHPDWKFESVESVIVELLEKKMKIQMESLRQEKKIKKILNNIKSIVRADNEDKPSRNSVDVRKDNNNTRIKKKSIESAAQRIIGKLHIKLLYGEDLIVDRKLTRNKAKPYVILKVGEQTDKSRFPETATKYPVWNQKFEFIIEESEKKDYKLEVQVMGDCSIEQDIFMGKEILDFADLLEQDLSSATVALLFLGPKKTAGRIFMELTFVRY